MASLLALAACNEIVGFGDLERAGADAPEGEDAGRPRDSGDKSIADVLTPDVQTPTAPDGGPRCSPTKPFAPPEAIAELDGADQTRSAIMSGDELEIFYLRGLTTPFELRHARRGSATDAWDAPKTEVMTESPVLLGSLTAGALKLYFYQPIVGSEPSKVFFATRPRRDEPFGAASRVGGIVVNDRYVVSTADDVAYTSRGTTGDGGVLENELLQATVFANSFGTPKQVPGIHAPGARDSRPVVNDGETILVFASARPGGPGALDLWMATRASRTDRFSPPFRIDELSSPSAEMPSWISGDGCVVLFDRGSQFLIARRPL
ncbi:MAG: hypothetical protein KIT84_19490 [Labilithrix sp.]|nr:hypothetical protein [Labilithrix sp.]MCW5813220.1 hypothetical protein [Labilithrix sp.]